MFVTSKKIESYDEETEKYYPLAVIECKAPEIYLDDKRVSKYFDIQKNWEMITAC